MSRVANFKEIIAQGGGVTRSSTLAEDAAQTLRSMILLETLPPGTALPERDLAEALGVSRTPMREAIRLLANDGLVEYTASRRPFVADPSLDDICDSLRVQGALEALAGELACANASSADLEEIERLNQAIIDWSQEDGKGDRRLEAFKADMVFHEGIVRAAGNAALQETHRHYNARLWRARFMSSQRRASRDSTHREHAAIVAGLLARDPVATAQALKQHLKTAETNIAQAIQDRLTETET